MFYYKKENNELTKIEDTNDIIDMFDNLYKDGIGEENEPKTINEYIDAINNCDYSKCIIIASLTKIDCE